MTIRITLELVPGNCRECALDHLTDCMAVQAEANTYCTAGNCWKKRVEVGDRTNCPLCGSSVLLED